jgi:hypothetical protein
LVIKELRIRENGNMVQLWTGAQLETMRVDSMVCIYIWVIYVVFFKKNNKVITSAQTLHVLILTYRGSLDNNKRLLIFFIVLVIAHTGNQLISRNDKTSYNLEPRKYI